MDHIPQTMIDVGALFPISVIISRQTKTRIINVPDLPLDEHMLPFQMTNATASEALERQWRRIHLQTHLRIERLMTEGDL